MKQTQRFILLAAFICIIQTAFAQENNLITNFSNKINSYLTNISSDGELDSYRIVGNKKIIIKGSFDNKRKLFHQVIVVYKSGLKKEITMIYVKALGTKFLIAKIVRINDNLYFAKYNEMKMAENKRFIRLYEETMIDRKIYNRIDYSTGQ